MDWYRRRLLPRLIHLACSGRPMSRQRQKLVPRAHGEVLEVGIGSGLNLPYYDPARVSEVRGIDPSEELWQLADSTRIDALTFPSHFIQGTAESIPLEAASVDTVVVTYSLCSIPDPLAALQEMRRVLRPSGRLLFCEHGLAPDRGVRRVQTLVNPAWRRLGGGCNLNRDIPALIGAAGFGILDLETLYLPGWRAVTYNYWGSASPTPPAD